MTQPLPVIFLWHMHQPYYKDPLREEFVLPWTYLHAIKDYYDMAAIVEETPGAKAVFNLVPSLLEQIKDYASGLAVDPFLIRGQMDPSMMGEEDRRFIVDNFFSANRQRMIEPYKRYFELFCLAGDGAEAKKTERLRNFRSQDILDLQVWFFLSWTGEAARRRYPEFQELIKKGKQFTLEDKDLLFATQRRILQEIIPLYRQLHETGKAELAVSPYFHPILPLLCDMKNAQTAMPRATLPTARFRHPEDARSQVADAVAYFESTFGFSPKGMWPSEGSVSDEALSVIADCGLEWIATDEGVLVHTLGGTLGQARTELYHPYSFQTAGKELKLLFRDHALSDLIGFTYSQWEPERAVQDFIARLREIKAQSPGCRMVPVILDGENAWEYYTNNGYDFLSSLYQGIATAEGFQLSTCSESMAHIPPRKTLTHIHPGSWINADYGIWVGHPEENRGWDYLAKARDTAVACNPQVAALLSAGKGIADSTSTGDQTARQICKSLFAAEGSDWFWWYGDDHFSPHSDRFDSLFRRHLMHIYKLLGQDIPPELFEPIKQKSPAGFVREPAGLISPAINGLSADYFKWLAAGLYDLSRQSSAMHASESLLQSFFYGYDREYFYFRIDGVEAVDKLLRKGDLLSLHLIVDKEYRLVMGTDSENGFLQIKNPKGWEDTSNSCRWKMARICEVAIPLSPLSPELGGKLFAYLTLSRSGEEIGRWPPDAPMLLSYAGPELELDNWLI